MPLTPRPRRRKPGRRHIQLSDSEDECSIASLPTAEQSQSCAAVSESELTSTSAASTAVPCPSMSLDATLPLTPRPQHKRRRLWLPSNSSAASLLPEAEEKSQSRISTFSFETRLPSRDAYLAAMVESWQTACSGDAEVTQERPLSPAPDLTMASVKERQCYFDSLVAKEMAWHKLLPKWRAVYDSARSRAGSCCFKTKQLSFSRHLVAKGTAAELIDTIRHEIGGFGSWQYKSKA